MRKVEDEQRLERRARSLGEFVDRVEQGHDLGGLPQGELRGFTYRAPTEADPGALLVIRAQGVEGRVIAFVGAYNLGDALLAWRARSKAGRIRWRADKPWGEREV